METKLSSKHYSFSSILNSLSTNNTTFRPRQKIKTLKTSDRLSVASVIRGAAPLARTSANRKRERSEDRGVADNSDSNVKKWKLSEPKFDYI